MKNEILRVDGGVIEINAWLRVLVKRGKLFDRSIDGRSGEDKDFLRGVDI